VIDECLVRPPNRGAGAPHYFGRSLRAFEVISSPVTWMMFLGTVLLAFWAATTTPGPF